MTKAENIRNQCMKILDKYDADYRGVTVDRIDGTTYVIFKYYGGTNDTVDRNDDSWDEMFELDGVVDVGYGEGYGIKGKYEDSLLIELDKDIVESKKSARKSLKEEKEIWIIKSKDDLQYVGKKIFDVCEDIENARKFKSKFEAEEFLKKHDKALDYRYWKVINIVSESKESARKSIKESTDVTDKIASEIDKSYWIDKLIDDLDKHYETMEKAWLKNLDKLSDEDILGIIDDCMGKSKTLVGKSEMLKNKMIDDLSKAYDDYIDDIDRQIRIGKSEDEVKEMIETTLENDIKMYLKLAYNNKASSNYFMVKFAEDNLI